MRVRVRTRAGDVTTRPGYVLFKFKQAEGGKRGGLGELEECQTLDWISMNSKEADRGREGGGGDGPGERERERRETIGMKEKE